ncbi:hypothetical protein JOC34_004406 [Virgibacillus halotolerans]|nr:hypothetical protein [Virgibacillus halotolerans]
MLHLSFREEGYLRLSWMVAEGSRLQRESTCPKTPQSGFLEETEAVPAESDYLEQTSYLNGGP